MTALSRSLRVRAVVAVAVGSLLSAAVVTAHADTAPPEPQIPPTVSADALPTTQVDGVVWSQAVVGNKVYAGGKFTTARPAGAAPGVSTTPRSNLLAYDITTGALDTSFAPSINGQVLSVTASPDGTRLYVAGDFTQVGGVTRNRVAAFNTSDGSLVSTFAPSVDARVRAVVATAGSVYAGGIFTTANGNARSRLAAFRPSDGALLPWAPAADAEVLALVVAPTSGNVVAGGRFATIGTTAAYGMAALEPTSGAVQPWAATQVVRNAGPDAAINSLSTDGTLVYGSGYVFGKGGNLEGSFAADPTTGRLVWIEDCHGDTYGVFPVGGVAYVVGHPHYCGNVGGFPQTDPWTFHRALAFSRDATGTVGRDPYGYYNFEGQPAPSPLTWYPDLDAGTYTGQSQAAWSVTGNADYVVLGGEFPKVNGVAQQGLVRFAVRRVAPNTQGPRVSGSAFVPSVASLNAGEARVGWQANWDRDNEALTYKVVRDGNTASPVYTTTARSTFWKRPTLGFRDTGLTPGQTYRYRLYASDPLGNTVAGDTVSVTVSASAGTSAYSKAVTADGASSYWRLGESSGTTGFDSVAFNDLTLGSGVTRGTAGAVPDDTATSFGGTSAGTGSAPALLVGPNTFSAEAWFQTTSTSGGKLIGFGDQPATPSSHYDRHVYLDNAGHVVFGIYSNGAHTLATTGTYNDGSWHQAVATLSPDGMVLYVDGKRIGRDAGTTTGEQYTGYWRIGGDNLDGWPSQPTSRWFTGGIDEVALYPTALTLSQVQSHYTATGRNLSTAPAPGDAYGSAVYAAGPDSYWRLGEASGTVAKDASPNGADGVYSGGVTYSVPASLPGTSDTAVSLDGTNGQVAAANAVTAPSVYSEELRFRTTTTRGGKLIGMGSSPTGNSGSYDRHVYMFDDGRLRFGVWTGQTNVIDTSSAYNDGKWHHLVATQGSNGMALYVDGALVGTNPQTQAQAYLGYWRVGGDTTWGGSTSNWFAGDVDEVAIYSSALSAATVADHWTRASGQTVNQPPTAAFTVTATGLSVAADGSGSTDADGTVASYAWDAGDGAKGTGKVFQHTYAAAGTYAVTLTVTDDKGATGTLTKQVTVTAPTPNQPPTAAFSSSAQDLTASFNGTTSTDPDGTVASWAWDFGDGTSGAGPTPQHVYASAGTRTVTLTVTDDKGATGAVSKSVTVTAPAPAANQPPTAAFTSTAQGLTAAFDGTGSTDADGTVTGWSWAFGDGATGSGASVQHAYTTAGTRTVTLTVTDDKGATGTVSRSVTVAAPAPTSTAFATDTFSRTTTGGWGTADLGGAWTVSGGAANFSVGSGVGRAVMPTAGAQVTALLTGTTSSDTDAKVSLTLDKAATGGGTYVSLVGRNVPGAGDYRLKVRVQSTGVVAVSLVRVVSGTETALASGTAPGTWTAGTTLRLRLQVGGTGPTALAAKVWSAAQTEPAAWLLTASDSTASLQTAGSVGLVSYLSSSSTNAPMTATFDDVSAGPRA